MIKYYNKNLIVFTTTIIMNEIVFTRYIYIKSEVKHSLLQSILDQDHEQSLYWAYELYYSGYTNELLEYLSDIFENYYSEYINLGKFLNKKCCEFADLDPEIATTALFQECMIGTIIRNLSAKPYNYNGVDRKIFIILNENDIIKYKTITTQTLNPRHILKKISIYIPFREPITIENYEPIEPIQYPNIQAKYYYHWLYYAAFSPIWATRIDKYKGIINHTTQSIDFPNDDLLEQFYDNYNYEPDEQPGDVTNKHITI